jgi:hypothetical protein
MGDCRRAGAAADLQHFHVGLKVLARDLQLLPVRSLV